MSRQTKQLAEQVYYPEEIPDTLTPEIERLSKERNTREYNERIEDIKNLRSIKQQRIQETKEDKYIHAIETIIEWTGAGKRTIPYLYFNLHYEEQQEFALFLDKLKEAQCFSGWTTNPYKDAYHLEFIFDNVNIALLQQFNESGKIVQFSSGQTVIYQNDVLFFKMGDGTPDSIDFSNAPVWKNILESFLELRKNTLRNIFSPAEVTNMHKQLFGKAIERRYLAQQISNIRNKKIKNGLKIRFKIEFDRPHTSWVLTLY